MTSENMYWLAENYWVGIGVITGVVVVLYVVSALLILFKARKMGVNVAMGAMLPVWNIKYIVQGILQNRPEKPKKVKPQKIYQEPEK